MHRNEKILKRHQREDCNGEEREWHPPKRTKVDRIKAIAERRNEATEIANGQIRKVQEDEWECVTCGKREKTANIKSLIGHLGKHNRNTQVGRKQESKKKSNKKGYKRKEVKKAQGKEKITGAKITENNTAIPEILRMMIFFGHIKEATNDEGEQQWACTKCEKSWPTAKGTQIHVTKSCWKFIPANNKMKCPFCKVEYKERKTLTGHMLQEGCTKYNEEYSHLTGPEVWDEIVKANSNNENE